jgi:fumarate hydratase class II
MHILSSQNSLSTTTNVEISRLLLQQQPQPKKQPEKTPPHTKQSYNYQKKLGRHHLKAALPISFKMLFCGSAFNCQVRALLML